MTNLQDRVVIVVGAGGGMGRAISAMLADGGAKVVLADFNADALAEVKSSLSGDVLDVVVDATDEAQVAALFDTVKSKFGHADALINLPGMSIAAKVAEMPLDDYGKIVDVNLKSAFLAAKYFVPLAAPDAQLLYMSSMAARRANPNAPVYVAAKAAVTMFAEGMALQLKDDGIRVTGLRPGPTDTDGFWGDRPVPREKFMQTSDIAEVVRFILTLPPRIVVHEIAFESYEFFKR